MRWHNSASSSSSSSHYQSLPSAAAVRNNNNIITIMIINIITPTIGDTVTALAVTYFGLNAVPVNRLWNSDNCEMCNSHIYCIICKFLLHYLLDSPLALQFGATFAIS